MIEKSKSGSDTHHVPEGGAGALAGRVVLQDGSVVDQFPDVVAVLGWRAETCVTHQHCSQNNLIAAAANLGHLIIKLLPQ